MMPTSDRRMSGRVQWRASRNLQRQRGVVLLFTMIAVVLLLIAAVALVRSVDSSQIIAGNIAFKRDLLNQGERGIALAKKSLSDGGALADSVKRQEDSLPNNYAATMLVTNAQGIPNILLSDTAWASSKMAGADIIDRTSGVTIRYVIDRLCTETGPPDSAKCVVTTRVTYGGSSHLIARRAGGSTPPIYRISVRVTGPHNTQTYMQSTFVL